MDAQSRGRTVLVGVDGSESASRAVRWAADEARRRAVPLRLVNAVSWLVEQDRLMEAPGEEHFRGILLDAAHGVLAEAAAAAATVAPGIEVEQQVVFGRPAPVLAGEAEHAQLLVIGDRGLGGVSGLLVGSVAVAMAAHGACPVVVVRGTVPDPGAPQRPIVVGVDGSPTSEAAIAFAYEAAAARRAPLIAVHTWQELPVDPAMGPMLDWDVIETQEREVLAERLAGWSGKYPQVRTERLVVCGRAAHVLREQSTRAQLVVVGSRGRGGFAGMLLGSVSQALLHRSGCPVAVVRPELVNRPQPA